MGSLEQGLFLALCGCSAAFSTLDVLSVFSFTVLSMCWWGHDSIHLQSRSLCSIVKLCLQCTDSPSCQGYTCPNLIPGPSPACILQSIEQWLYNWILFFQTQTHLSLPCQKGSVHRADRCCPVSPNPTYLGLTPSIRNQLWFHSSSEVFCGQGDGSLFLGVAGWGRADTLVSEGIKRSMTLLVIFKIAANPWSWALSQHTGIRKETTNKPWRVRGPGRWM